MHTALQVADVDLPAFDDFFGRRLGRFRAYASDADKALPAAKELALIAETIECLEHARARLEWLPERAARFADEACMTIRGERFRDCRQRLDADLRAAFDVLTIAERKLEPLNGNAGRKRATLRDHLLHDVAHWLHDHGVAVTAAAETAAGALRAAGIDAPDDPKKARGIVRAVETERAKNSR